MGKLKRLFTNHNETRDDHRDESLKSHYYKTSQKKAMEAVKEMIEQMDGYTITSISEERGEMSIKGKKSFIVATVISVRPFETSVDFSATTNTLLLPIDFGASHKLITTLYQTLDRKLPFIHAGGSQ
ncbi:cytosolic protein [Bacillus sp. PS06]|uniref:cytosolic protein n=1 Tax=Bacillus sp. PS06 TaxID=2764176 RepID=UPI001784060D|nr:cytosolic protein [Bacillus sp. PS06]MBD8068933.1 cytosolic protein [Bacillus sp. PS06]